MITCSVFLGFPCGSAGKESACNVGDLGSIPGLGRSPGEGKGYPTPVFWPGEFHGLYSPWSCKELASTKDFHSTSLLGPWRRAVSHPTPSPLPLTAPPSLWPFCLTFLSQAFLCKLMLNSQKGDLKYILIDFAFSYLITGKK